MYVFVFLILKALTYRLSIHSDDRIKMSKNSKKIRQQSFSVMLQMLAFYDISKSSSNRFCKSVSYEIRCRTSSYGRLLFGNFGGYQKHAYRFSFLFQISSSVAKKGLPCYFRKSQLCESPGIAGGFPFINIIYISVYWRK